VHARVQQKSQDLHAACEEGGRGAFIAQPAGRVTRAEVRLGTQIRGGRKLGKEFAQEGGNPTEHGTKESFDRYHVIKE
jgi:hypothetical protein